MNEKQPAVDPAAAAFDDYSDVVLDDVMYETGSAARSSRCTTERRSPATKRARVTGAAGTAGCSGSATRSGARTGKPRSRRSRPGGTRWPRCAPSPNS